MARLLSSLEEHLPALFYYHNAMITLDFHFVIIYFCNGDKNSYTYIDYNYYAFIDKKTWSR